MRALLDQQKLAAAKVALGRAEQHGQLQWKDQWAIEILVQAVVVIGLVFEDQWGRPRLARLVAFVQIGTEGGRKPPLLAEPFVPAIGDRCEMRVDRLAKRLDDGGQRVAQILVLATAKAVALHDDPAAKGVLTIIE